MSGWDGYDKDVEQRILQYYFLQEESAFQNQERFPIGSNAALVKGLKKASVASIVKIMNHFFVKTGRLFRGSCHTHEALIAHPSDIRFIHVKVEGPCGLQQMRKENGTINLKDAQLQPKIVELKKELGAASFLPGTIASDDKLLYTLAVIEQGYWGWYASKDMSGDAIDPVAEVWSYKPLIQDFGGVKILSFYHQFVVPSLGQRIAWTYFPVTEEVASQFS